MIRRLALLAAALAVVAPPLVAFTATQAGANVELSFTEHETNFEAVIDGHATLNPTSPPGPGDTFVFRGDLLQGTTVIGFDNGQCVVTFNDNTLCTAVFAINGKGDIMGTALVRGEVAGNGPTVFDGAITGGTFTHRNIHGDGHAVVANQTDTNWTLNLVTD